MFWSIIIVLVGVAAGQDLLPGWTPHPGADLWPCPPGTICVVGVVARSGDGTYASENTQNALGMLMARDMINAQGGILVGSTRYNLSVVLGDVMVGGTLTERLPRYADVGTYLCRLPMSERPHLLVGPFSSSPSSKVLDAVHNGTGHLNPRGCGIPVGALASVPALFAGRNFTYTPLPSPDRVLMAGAKLFQRVLPPNARVAIVSVAGDLLADSFSTNLAKMVQGGQFGTGATLVGRRCGGQMTQPSSPDCYADADCPGSTCTTARFLPLSGTIEAVSYTRQLSDWVTALQMLSPDLLIIGGHLQDTASWINLCSLSKFAPGGFYGSMPMSLAASIRAAPSEYVYGNSFLLADSGYGVSGRYLGTSAEFCAAAATAAAKYFAAGVYPAGTGQLDECYLAGMGADTLVMFQHALEQYPGWSPTLDRWATFDQLMNLVATPFESFWGRHGLLGGINQAKMAEVFQIQRINGTLQLIRFNGGEQPIYPAPSPWVTYHTSSATWAGVIVLMVISISALVGEAGLLVRHRQEPHLKAASWPFLILMIVAASAATATVPVYLVDQLTPTICGLWLMLPLICLTMIFSALLVTTWRIKRIFTKTDLKVEALPNCLLASWVVGALLGVVALVGGAMAAWSPAIGLVIERDDASQHYLRYQACTFGWGPIVAALVPGGLVTLYGVHLAWQIRDVPGEFNNSQHVATALLFTSGYSIVAVAVLFLVGTRPDVLAIYCSLSLILCVHITVQAVVLPKLIGRGKVVPYQITKVSSRTQPTWAVAVSTSPVARAAPRVSVT